MYDTILIFVPAMRTACLLTLLILQHAANYDHLELSRFLIQVGCRATEADM